MATEQGPAATASSRGGWGAAVRETHSAVVVLLGDRAYKVKKPVDLGFLDFTSLASRAAAVARELRLNRRTAPDVYLGTLEVRDPDGTVCDHLLVMRRMPEDRRLATLVRDGVDVAVPLRQLARDLAAFHSTARTGPAIDACGRPEALRRRWVDNVRGLREHPVDTVAPELLDRVERLALEFVGGREPLLQSRIDAGLVRDGHGDLLADDVFCLDDGPRALDCLDFADELRWMDVLDDAACLATDLERLGDPGAGQQFLHDYEEFSGRRQPPALRHHYTAYRAVMRAKVAAIRAAAHGLPSGADADEARQLLDIGLTHLLRGRVRLVLVGGGPGSGKSTLSSGLADRLGAVLLASDPERKALMGLDPTSHAPAAFGEGIYTRAVTERTYASLADRARVLLGLGETVVVDASFSSGSQRDLFRRVGGATSAPVTELVCTATPQELERRLLRRADVPDEHSDADLVIGRRLTAAADPWPEAVEVPTGEGSKAETLERALQSLLG